MKKVILLIVLLLFLRQLSFPQGKRLIDSLQIILKTEKQDTTKANILYQLSKVYWRNDHDKTMDYARQALAISEHIGFAKGMGNAYNIMGVILYGNGEYEPAMEFHKKALKIRQEDAPRQGPSAWSR